MAAALSTASALGLDAEDAVVLNNSNRIAVRLLPAEVVARVAPAAWSAGAEFEVAVAQGLAETGSPVGEPDPRVAARGYLSDGFAITFWTYYEALPPHDVAAPEYAKALTRLHAGMREVDFLAPHFTDRVAEAQELVADHARTPDLTPGDRDFLSRTLRSLRRSVSEYGAPEQLLHGEPHPGNVLRTKNGLLFVDFETCCRGPVEFDIAHAPDDVASYYPGANEALLKECRVLMLAMVTTWRWDREDQLPNGRQLRAEGLSQLRAAVAG